MYNLYLLYPYMRSKSSAQSFVLTYGISHFELHICLRAKLVWSTHAIRRLLVNTVEIYSKRAMHALRNWQTNIASHWVNYSWDALQRRDGLNVLYAERVEWVSCGLFKKKPSANACI